MEAYLGDGILLADSETNIPFSTIHWTVQQAPSYGNSYHPVSIFRVPERIARHHLYRYAEHYVPKECYRAEDTEYSIGMRSYIYLLPHKYLKHSRFEDRVPHINYRLIPCLYGNDQTPQIQTVYQFQDRASFSNFLDGDGRATNNAVGCSCNIDNSFIDRECLQDDKECIEKIKRDLGCKGECYRNLGPLTANQSSYNFFSTYTPEGAIVKYNISVEMFFYNHTLLGNHLACTIRGTDTCPIQTPSYVEHWPFKEERYLLIAYAHPTSVPGYYSTRLHVHAKLQVDYIAMFAFLCAAVVFFIIKHCLKGC